MRNKILELITSICPLDSLEEKHIQDVKEWIKSGEEIFRVSKPDNPPKHLVSYFLLFDQENKKFLMVNHRNAGLWLPPGGHVEPNENPSFTVIREAKEELGIHAEFITRSPLFLTVTKTIGLTKGHTDVSLWYLLKGNSNKHLLFDQREFSEIKWFSFEELPFQQSDPHLKRFIKKLNL